MIRYETKERSLHQGTVPTGLQRQQEVGGGGRPTQRPTNRNNKELLILQPDRIKEDANELLLEIQIIRLYGAILNPEDQVSETSNNDIKT